jgi:hypothetical protein
MVVIAWTLPLSGQAGDTPSDKLSPEFSKAAMTALADTYRWKEAALAATKSPLTASTAGRPLKSVAYEDVRLAQMSAKTQGDQEAGTLLEKHFSDVDAWVNKLIEARKNLDASNVIDPSSADQDPDLIKINNCGKAFNAMLGSGSYTPIAECQ